MTVSQMCTCGARFEAESVPAVWKLMDEHADAVHGRRFPRGAVIARDHPYGKTKTRRAPLTPQGGNS